MSYTHVFPIKIEYQDTKKVVVVKKPEDIESGRVFIVLELEVK